MLPRMTCEIGEFQAEMRTFRKTLTRYGNSLVLGTFGITQVLKFLWRSHTKISNLGLIEDCFSVKVG